MQRISNVAEVNGVFAALLSGVRACTPKCAQCTRPLGDEQEQSHVRVDVQGAERVCHSCFISEIAEELVNTSPGLR